MAEESKNIIRVGIVEDNKTLGRSLKMVVDSMDDATCIDVWPTAEDGLKAIAETKPDIVLMDINLPGMSGIQATAHVKQDFPEIKVIIVTVHREHQKIFDALKAGAAGYLIKRSKPAEVREAIMNVRDGGAPMSAEIARRVVEAFHAPAQAAEEPEEETVQLSQRETDVVQLVSEGLVNKEIAKRLGLSVETVRGHLKSIYEKLHVRSRTQAALKYRDSIKPRGPS